MPSFEEQRNHSNEYSSKGVSGNSLEVRGLRVTEAEQKNPLSDAEVPGELQATLQPLRRIADDREGERGEPFVSLKTKVQTAAMSAKWY